MSQKSETVMVHRVDKHAGDNLSVGDELVVMFDDRSVRTEVTEIKDSSE